MTVAQTIDAVLDELGIRKIVTQGSKSARVEYQIAAAGGEGKYNLLEAVHQKMSLMRSLTVLGAASPLIPHLKRTTRDVADYRVILSISEAWYSRIGTVAKSFSKALQRPTLGTVTARTRREESPGYSTSTTPSAWRPASIFNSLWQSPTSNVGDDSQDTIRAGPDSDDEDEEGEGTLKGFEQALKKPIVPTRLNQASRGNTRLSSLFDVWAYPAAPPDQAAEKESLKQSIGRSRMVSEPMPVDDFRGMSTLNLDIASLASQSENGLNTESASSAADLDSEFERMMDQLGIKENQRNAMRLMDEQRKRFLIAQQQQKESGGIPQPIQSHRTGPERSSGRQTTASYTSPTMALSGLKRFSLWSTGTSSPVADDDTQPHSPKAPASPVMSDTASVLSFASQDTEAHTPPAPLLQTATGWSSWFSAGSPAKPLVTSNVASSSSAKDTPIFYISQIVDGKLDRANLAKHLIALRVRLATAALVWIQDFLQHDGLAALEKVLRTFTAKTSSTSSRDAITELDESIQTETIRCLRIILNTEVSTTRPTGLRYAYVRDAAGRI